MNKIKKFISCAFLSLFSLTLCAGNTEWKMGNDFHSALHNAGLRGYDDPDFDWSFNAGTWNAYYRRGAKVLHPDKWNQKLNRVSDDAQNARLQRLAEGAAEDFKKLSEFNENYIKLSDDSAVFHGQNKFLSFLFGVAASIGGAFFIKKMISISRDLAKHRAIIMDRCSDDTALLRMTKIDWKGLIGNKKYSYSSQSRKKRAMQALLNKKNDRLENLKSDLGLLDNDFLVTALSGLEIQLLTQERMRTLFIVLGPTILGALLSFLLYKKSINTAWSYPGEKDLRAFISRIIARFRPEPSAKTSTWFLEDKKIH